MCVTDHLTMYTLRACFFTCHANAAEASDSVQTGSIILAWAGQALVDIEFTASPYVALRTLTLE